MPDSSWLHESRAHWAAVWCFFRLGGFAQIIVCTCKLGLQIAHDNKDPLLKTASVSLVHIFFSFSTLHFFIAKFRLCPVAFQILRLEMPWVTELSLHSGEGTRSECYQPPPWSSDRGVLHYKLFSNCSFKHAAVVQTTLLHKLKRNALLSGKVTVS